MFDNMSAATSKAGDFLNQIARASASAALEMNAQAEDLTLIVKELEDL